MPKAVLVVGLAITALGVGSNLQVTARLQQLRREQALSAVCSALLARAEGMAAVLQGLAGLAELRGSPSPWEFSGLLERIHRGTTTLEEGQPVGWITSSPTGEPRLLLHDPPDGLPRSTALAWREALALPAVREVMERARSDGRPQLSHPIRERIVSQIPRGSSVMLVAPVVGRPKEAATPAGSRPALKAWVAMPLPIEALVNGALRTSQFQLQEPVDLQLYAGEGRRPQALVHDSTGGPVPRQAEAGSRRDLEILGSQWIVVTQLPWLGRGNDGVEPWQRVLAGGLALTALLTARSHRLVGLNRRRIEALEQLRISAEAFRQIQEGVVITDLAGRPLTTNDAYCRMLGTSAPELALRETHLRDWLAAASPSTEDVWAKVGGNGSWQGELWGRRHDGSTFPAWVHLRTITAPDGEPSRYLATLTDLSRLREKDDRLRYIGYHDPLTELANLRLAWLQLQEQIHANRQRLEIYWLGLDGLQLINNSFGHQQGDQVLLAVAARLRRACGAQDVLARVGSDEFLVVRQADPQGAAPEATAHGLINLLRPPLTIGEGVLLELSAGVGVSRYPEHGNDPGPLLQFAATALTDAKRRGPGSVKVYDPSMTAETQRRLLLESALQRGIENGELHLEYQPQTDGEGRIVGAECLARWQSPRFGTVHPAEFIPIAEVSGLIHRIGEWVLREACGQSRRWRQGGLQPPPLAVNVSNRQFLDPGRSLADLVRSILEANALPSEALELEFTESCLLPGSGALREMRCLAEMGVAMAVDDFGTDFSSLSALHQFPISRIKIDRCFITDIDRQESSQAIVKSSLAMARELGLHTLAEGVDRAEELQLLRRFGCEAFQGFLLSRPLPAAEFALLLATPELRLPLGAGPAVSSTPAQLLH